MPVKSKIKALLSSFLIACGLLTVNIANAAVATYTYDELDRLTRVDYNDGTVIIYAYDQIGNRLNTYTNPKASFTYSATAGILPLTVNFTDTSTGNAAAWVWNFGDGSSSSTEQNPSHTFNSAGTYTVKLTVSNPVGSNSITKTSIITVQVCTNSHVRIVGKSGYNTLQSAYNAAASGDIIQAQAQTFAENFTANRDVSVTIDGGYLCNYSSNPGVTTIRGAPVVSSGTVKIKNFSIKK